METQNESERQLSENLSKCRCCFRMLIDDRRAVRITEEIRDQFKNLTQIELLESEIFADKVCQLCASDLSMFANLRDDLVSKQKALYLLAGIEDLNFDKAELILNEEESQLESQEETSDFDLKFETIEEDDDATIYVEEQVEEHFITEDQELEAAETILEIEKVSESKEDVIIDKMEADQGELFDYFEEIVADDSNDQYYEVKEDTEEDNAIISCDTCGVELAKNHLIQHVLAMHAVHSCHHCEKKFQSKISMRRHVIENHPGNKTTRSKKRHFCPLCPKDYDYQKQLDDHIRSFHEKERNSECHICNKTFYHRDLKKHIEHVHGDKKISCQTCGKMYTCVENLRLHLRYHQPPSFVCTFEGCGKKFHQKVLWEHHEKKHTDDKPHACEHCSANFYSLRDLKRHFQRVHEKVTRKCFLCEAQFSRKDKYRLHLLKKHHELSEDDRETYLEQIRNMKWHES